jgi:hypothetical protein
MLKTVVKFSYEKETKNSVPYMYTNGLQVTAKIWKSLLIKKIKFSYLF